ncbi:MAG: hydrolase, partial [Tannerella sp.]|nr:hydrolase [Tannerella sp.]
MKPNILLFFCLFLTCNLQAKMNPVGLTCEMMRNPLAVETSQPRFGWKLLSDVQGDRQTAYRIFISQDNSTKYTWDSGKKQSDQSQLVVYKGKKLQVATRYYWYVKVWDMQGNETESEPFYFETAPTFSPNTQWIGAITKADAYLPTGRRDFHAPSLKKEENKNIFDRIHPLALRSICLRKTFNALKP